jgi:hypothetical protein
MEPKTHEEEPGHVGARLETDTDHADEVHTPHGNGGEARRGETEEEVVSQTSGTRPSAEKEKCRIGTEDGDDDGEDEDAWERADGDSPVRVVRDELDGVCNRIVSPNRIWVAPEETELAHRSRYPGEPTCLLVLGVVQGVGELQKSQSDVRNRMRKS